MIWFVGIYILLLLLSSEMIPSAPVQNNLPDNLQALLWIALATMGVPLFASIQSVVVVKRWGGTATHALGSYEPRALRSLHLACVSIWACSALSIVTVLGWPTIVRNDWQLDRIPLLDELVIALPIIGSITIAWILLHSAEQTLVKNRESTRLQFNIHDAWRSASARLRLICGLLLLPLAIFFLSRDVVSMMAPSGGVSQWTTAMLLIDLIILVFLYPWLISKTWQTRDIQDRSLLARLNRAAAESGMTPLKTKFWKTGRQLANAVVVGLIPRTRTVFLSDLLIEYFETDEIEAIYHHELAHLRCRHLPLRFCYLILPVVIGLLILSHTEIGVLLTGGTMPTWPATLCWIGLAMVALTYYILFVNWMLRHSEIEADMVACLNANREFDEKRAEVYRLALLKMAALTPELYDRNTLAHPSIKSRIQWLSHCCIMPCRVTYFRRRFRRIQICVILSIGTITSLTCAFA